MKFCLECGQPLTGKQRKFCSNACKFRYHRAVQSGSPIPNDTKSIPNDTKSIPNDTKSAILRSKATRNVRVKLSVVVIFEGSGKAGEWDKALVNKPVMMQLEQLIRDHLLKSHPKWEITFVKMERIW